MKCNLKILLIIMAVSAGSIGALAQGTAFTYQGRLNNNGNPANGSYDLSFSLYNASSGGSAVAGPLTNSAAGVTNGLFTVTLDFGSGVFTGTTYWLDISVRTNGGGSFADLSPRQQVTPAPYAVFSESAGLAASVTANGVSAPQLNTGGAPTSGEVLAFNGTSLVWTNPPARGGGWSLTGNTGTIPGTDFLGTSDNEPFELWVNGARALRLEPGSFGPNVIGGAPNNSVAPGNMASTIGGGVNNNITGANNNSGTIAGGSGNTVASGVSGGAGTVGGGFQNTVSNLYPTISGGEYNSATANGAVVGGGYNNTASGKEATVSGGTQNIASGAGAFVGGGGYDGTTTGGNSAVNPAATVGGGLQNAASASYATVGGGSLNTASGLNAVVPGGYFNTAFGSYSLAAGYGAEAMNSGAFVWADNSGGFFSSTANNQFSVRANGGVRFVTGGAGVTIDGVPVGSGGGGTSGWGLTGNAGTDPNVNFLGTTDSAGLELHVDSTRGLRIDFASRPSNPGSFLSSINVDGGFGKNIIAFPNPSFGAVLGGTIAGGGYSQFVNLNETDFPNTINNDFGAIGGGFGNTAGLNATVPGGYNNSATGDGSFAAGRNAQTTYAGNFIWGDGTRTFTGSGVNHFDVLASGGVNFNAGNNDFSVVGEYMSIRGLGNEQAYIGGDGSGNDVQIGSLTSGITAVACYNATDNAYMHLYVSSITIEGGSDLAEPFQISAPDQEIPQGAVVVIDEENPGHLKLSGQSYDTRVAGVVSGANGIHPGIQMQQQGLLEGGKNVALTGRVYVRADTSNGPIKPGDLLTSSTAPGRAMRVSDHARAQGAILGKAMTGLKDGQGMVLVLVTLQ